VNIDFIRFWMNLVIDFATSQYPSWWTTWPQAHLGSSPVSHRCSRRGGTWSEGPSGVPNVCKKWGQMGDTTGSLFGNVWKCLASDEPVSFDRF
jgi:hypothetical protein